MVAYVVSLLQKLEYFTRPPVLRAVGVCQVWVTEKDNNLNPKIF